MEWKIAKQPVDYEAALAFMEERAAAIRAGTADECVWLLEHPHLYTAGTSTKADEKQQARGLPVYTTGRGGQLTYHGPGQRIAYVMLDLQQRQPDLRWYIAQLENWLIATLAQMGITGERREGRVGIWVRTGKAEAKIAAIGVRVRRWVTFHGVSLNVYPDLEHFSGIIPCGIREYGVTSVQALGHTGVTMAIVDAALRKTFTNFFPAVSEKGSLTG